MTNTCMIYFGKRINDRFFKMYLEAYLVFFPFNSTKCVILRCGNVKAVSALKIDAKIHFISIISLNFILLCQRSLLTFFPAEYEDEHFTKK